MSHKSFLTTERIERIRPHLPVVLAVANSLVWLLAVPSATLLRYDFNISRSIAPGIRGALLVAVIVQGAAGFAIGVYRRKWVYGSFEEVLAQTSSVLITGSVIQIYGVVVGPTELPRSVPTVATFLAVNVTIATRSLYRLARQRALRHRAAEPLVVVGAGSAGEQIIRTLLSDAKSPYVPVAIVDDSRNKQALRLSGVAVQGRIDELTSVVQKYSARVVLLAIPSAAPELVRRVAALAQAGDAQLLVLPRVDEMFGAVTLGDIRPVQPEDLLGRAQVDLDAERLKSFVAGRRVLVTGAGGSIGSELCRQLSQLEPESLVMLDRDESGLHSTQLLVDGHGLLDSPDIVLADIRDSERVKEVFENCRPDVVFHAAALKHMPLLEAHPLEGWKTNVVGTWNVLSAAEQVGVEHFVNVSTDKAANPENVLGRTKRLTERLTAGFGRRCAGEWVSVRFGNVLGSRGSVLTSFRAQVERGGPITVTHPDVTRYFMTVAEAVRLTIYSAAIGESGQVMVLDMGEPVRILDVAQRFAELAVPPLEIVFTGLRPGEKLHEVLLADGEIDLRPTHPLISQVDVESIDFVDVSPGMVADDVGVK